MSLGVPHSAFWEGQVNFGLPPLKYSYTLHAKFWVGRPVIIIDRCVIKLWFAFANLQSTSLKLPSPPNIVFPIIFCTE